MQNIKLTLQYDGTRYLGWKRPENAQNPAEKSCDHIQLPFMTGLIGYTLTNTASMK